ncbi:hypothetical protein [Formosa sp. A9]|uniref:hypothetical protein n=1 Tax=Formosa sp. A9 TaxID=3442641 RepID=UPI003EB7FC58
MNLFNQRKNKSFNYKPKFQEDTSEHDSKDIASKWQDIKQTRKYKTKKGNVLLRWIVLLVMILVLWYVLNNYEM